MFKHGDTMEDDCSLRLKMQLILFLLFVDLSVQGQMCNKYWTIFFPLNAMRTPYDFFLVNDFIQRIQTDFPLALFSVNSMFHKTITIWTERLNLQRFRGEFR